MGPSAVETLLARVAVVRAEDASERLGEAAIVFEGVPEVVDLKRAVLAASSKHTAPEAIIASTTSTILVDDISGAVERPERFLNAHWLNLAYLVPHVELSPGERTDPALTDRLRTLLESIGKVPVICAARPGYIVPRTQALAMNEATRMVEEGVASPEEIDKAIKYGLGFRFAVLGLLEFIDWGAATSFFTQAAISRGARVGALRGSGDRRAQHARRTSWLALAQGPSRL